MVIKFCKVDLLYPEDWLEVKHIHPDDPEEKITDRVMPREAVMLEDAEGSPFIIKVSRLSNNTNIR